MPPAWWNGPPTYSASPLPSSWNASDAAETEIPGPVDSQLVPFQEAQFPTLIPSANWIEPTGLGIARRSFLAVLSQSAIAYSACSSALRDPRDRRSRPEGPEHERGRSTRGRATCLACQALVPLLGADALVLLDQRHPVMPEQDRAGGATRPLNQIDYESTGRVPPTSVAAKPRTARRAARAARRPARVPRTSGKAGDGSAVRLYVLSPIAASVASTAAVGAVSARQHNSRSGWTRRGRTRSTPGAGAVDSR